MLQTVRIEGTQPIIMHSAAGMDPSIPANLQKKEITSKRGSNRTAADEERLRQLDCLTSFWLDSDGRPTIPPAAFRSCIETAARKMKQGPQVREGLVSLSSRFEYDAGRYGETLDELVKTCQFIVPVVINRSRVMSTRAMFDVPWSCEFELDTDTELVDESQLESWLDIAGRRIGLGDWRPAKSGQYGRFEASIVPAEARAA